jgi:hypothetical protein
MSNQNSSNEQEPETTRRERLEKKLEKYRFFHNSSLGKKWTAYKEKLSETKKGKRLLLAINVLSWVGLLAIAPYGFDKLDDLLSPPDYTLTEEQVNEGYSRTRWEGFRASSRTQQDIYYRFYEDDEYNLPSCDTNFDWCIFAIPLYKDCSEITMKFETTKTQGSSEVVEEIEVSVQSKNGVPFFLGQRTTLGVKSTKSDSMYGSVKNIYCTL